MLDQSEGQLVDGFQDERVLVSRRMLMLMAAIFAGLINFYALFSVIPFDAASVEQGANPGLVNGAMMAAAIVTEIAVPVLVRRLGYRSALRLGLMLLAVPTIGLVFVSATELLVALNILRGVGLGILFVVGAPMAAALARPDRERSALAFYGVVAGLPALLALPGGVFAAAKFGTHAVYLVCGGLALLGLLLVPCASNPPRVVSESSSWRHCGNIRHLVLASVAFFLVAAANGAALVLMPQVQKAAHGSALVVALFANGAAMLLLRAVSPNLMNRLSSLVLMASSLLACGFGFAMLAMSVVPWALLVGMTALGGAFGVAQNVSLSMLFEAVAANRRDAASVIWSVAYDGGLGAGPWASGLATAVLGLPTAMALISASFLPTAAVLFRSRRTQFRVPA